MPVETFETWCPCFPGFYESPLYHSDMDYYETEAIVNDYPTKIPRDLLRYFFRENRCGSRGEVQMDFARYQKDVAIKFCEVVADHLAEIIDGCVIEYEGIVSPREYNFRTDVVHCSIKFNPDEAVWYCRRHADQFAEYLIANYKSRDGFISFHSYDPADWLDPQNWGGHEPGAILDFILRNERGDECEAELSQEALEDIYQGDYYSLPDELAEYLESEDADKLAREYNHEMQQGVWYIEAMGGTERAKKLVAEGKDRLLKHCFKQMCDAVRAL